MSNTDTKIQALLEIADKIAAMTDTTTVVVAKPQETKEQMWWTVAQVARFTPGAAGYVSQAEALAIMNQIMSLEKQLADVKSELACAYGTMRNANPKG